jgi:serine/threonine protein phosphatase PrpC
VHITSAGRSDVGVIRSGNEDNYIVVPERGIFVVADGMGGDAAGEVGSAGAVHKMTRELGQLGISLTKKSRSACGATARPTRRSSSAR